MPYLSSQQARLQDDIRGLIRGEVCCDEITRQVFSTDAGILQCQPQGVVWPRDVNDVAACVQYAAEKHIPIHPRGAGTGTTGEALGSGIVLDFSRFMRRLLALNRDSVVVQPGMVGRRLNGVLDKIQSRTFAPVSGFQSATTIGSVLARNGAGVRWLQYGFPDEHLLELKVVLANGEILTLNREALPHAIDTPQSESIPKNTSTAFSNSSFFGGRDPVARGIALARGIVLGKEHPVADEVYRVLAPSLRQINSEASRQIAVNRTGYCCHGVLQGEEGHSVDLAQLLLGSEGTLGLIVEAKLKTVPCPKREAGVVFFFNGLEKAMLAVSPIRSFQPALCELVDRRRLSMVCEWDSRFQRFIPTEAEAVLFVELDAGNLLAPDDSNHVRQRLTQLIETVQEKERLCFHAIRIETTEGCELFDDFLHRTELVLFRMRRSFQPFPIFDDLAVPIPALRDFLMELLNVLKRHEITASISGHVGQGQLRVHPIIDFSKSEPVLLLGRLTEDVYAVVLEHGGSVSSESGTGLLKSRLVPEQLPNLMPLFRNIKEIFDPDHLFNPGKVVPDSSLWTNHLRRGLSCRGVEHPEKRASESNFRETNRMSSGLFPYMEAETTETPETLPEVAEQNTSGNLSSQIELQLKWEPQHVFESTYLCNGCG
ncbi:MAG: FAD-binding oxidoreductase, partial [Planctomycetaceae bacterium]|nr:FAD-binding oxidoreductase [Planctomycetaceae bacterium]